MNYRFYIADVFTKTRFGGNQLAVLPDARGLSDEQMLQITREFYFSESTFVLPAEDGQNTRQVRIFTPGGEVPFAGHPNVGTAFALAKTSTVTTKEGNNLFRFEEKAGLVPVAVTVENGEPVNCELTAPASLETGTQFDPAQVAHALHLPPDAIVTTHHQPVEASVGLAFALVELASLEALGNAKADQGRLEGLLKEARTPGVHLYTWDCEGLDWDLQTRMYAPGMGIIEDPATGSANCALAGYLAHLDEAGEGEFAWTIAQGVEMGRPSLLEARVSKTGGQVEAVRIGGSCVMVASGELEI